MKRSTLISIVLCMSLFFAGCGYAESNSPNTSIKDRDGQDQRKEETTEDRYSDENTNQSDGEADSESFDYYDDPDEDPNPVLSKEDLNNDAYDWSKRSVESDSSYDDNDETDVFNPNPDIKDGADEYLLPDSDSRYLTEEDLDALDPDDLRYARNELYARHGRKFSDPDLQAYFDEKNWYHGTINPSEFDEKILNEYESYNRDFIVKYEKKRN